MSLHQITGRSIVGSPLKLPGLELGWYNDAYICTHEAAFSTS
jgi:hypothetical protein